MPGAFQIAAKSMGRTTAELNKMLELGKVSAEEFIPNFSKALREFASKGLTNATKSFTAEINRAKNALTDFYQSVGEAGLISIFTGALRAMRVGLIGLSAVLYPFISALKFLTTPMRFLIGLFSEMNTDILKGVKGLESLSAFFQLLGGSALGLVILKLLKFRSLLQVLTFVTKGLAVVLLPLLAKAAILAVFVGLVSDLVELTTDTGRKTIFHYLMETFPALTPYIEGFVSLIKTMRSALTDFLFAWDQFSFKDSITKGMENLEIFLDRIEEKILKARIAWNKLTGDDEEVKELQGKLQGVSESADREIAPTAFSKMRGAAIDNIVGFFTESLPNMLRNGASISNMAEKAPAVQNAVTQSSNTSNNVTINQTNNISGATSPDEIGNRTSVSAQEAMLKAQTRGNRSG